MRLGKGSLLHLVGQLKDTYQHLDQPDLADETEDHLWRRQRGLQCLLFSWSWTLSKKISRICGESGRHKAMKKQVHRAQGSRNSPLWHRGGWPLQRTGPWACRFQLSAIWKNTKLRSLCHWSEREFLDRKVWSPGRRRHKQEQLRSNTMAIVIPQLL